MEHRAAGEWLVKTGAHWDRTSLIISYVYQDWHHFLIWSEIPCTTSHTTPVLRWFNIPFYDLIEERNIIMKKYLK